MNGILDNHFKHHEDGKQLYVYRENAYLKDAQIENFKKRGATGWKIHLNLPADKNHPLTAPIASFLNTHPFVRHYKIGCGGDEEYGSGMTIYVGSWDRVATLAHTLHEAFSSRLPSAIYKQDMRLIGNVVARFDAVNFEDANGKFKYENYGPTNALAVFRTSHDKTISNLYMWGEIKDQPPKIRRIFGQRMIDAYIDDFGDYLLGSGKTGPYVHSGRRIEALPKWAQHWIYDARVPFDLETARLQPAAAEAPMRPVRGWGSGPGLDKKEL